jgi:hypothetical protein
MLASESHPLGLPYALPLQSNNRSLPHIIVNALELETKKPSAQFFGYWYHMIVI